MYEYAGGREAWLRLSEAHYKKCINDPILKQVFGTEGRPGHVEHLADWLGEIFGGPAFYTQKDGGHSKMVGYHLGKNITEEQRKRFVELLMEAAVEVGMPKDEEFREQLKAYFDWGSKLAKYYSQPGNKGLPEGKPTPSWGWNGLESNEN